MAFSFEGLGGSPRQDPPVCIAGDAPGAAWKKRGAESIGFHRIAPEGKTTHRAIAARSSTFISAASRDHAWPFDSPGWRRAVNGSRRPPTRRHWLALVIALTAFGGFFALLINFVE